MLTQQRRDQRSSRLLLQLQGVLSIALIVTSYLFGYYYDACSSSPTTRLGLECYSNAILKNVIMMTTTTTTTAKSTTTTATPDDRARMDIPKEVQSSFSSSSSSLFVDLLQPEDGEEYDNVNDRRLVDNDVGDGGGGGGASTTANSNSQDECDNDEYPKEEKGEEEEDNDDDNCASPTTSTTNPNDGKIPRHNTHNFLAYHIQIDVNGITVNDESTNSSNEMKSVLRMVGGNDDKDWKRKTRTPKEDHDGKSSNNGSEASSSSLLFDLFQTLLQDVYHLTIKSYHCRIIPKLPVPPPEPVAVTTTTSTTTHGDDRDDEDVIRACHGILSLDGRGGGGSGSESLGGGGGHASIYSWPPQKQRISDDREMGNGADNAAAAASSSSSSNGQVVFDLYLPIETLLRLNTTSTTATRARTSETDDDDNGDDEDHDDAINAAIPTIDDFIYEATVKAENLYNELRQVQQREQPPLSRTKLQQKAEELVLTKVLPPYHPPNSIYVSIIKRGRGQYSSSTSSTGTRSGEWGATGTNDDDDHSGNENSNFDDREVDSEECGNVDDLRGMEDEEDDDDDSDDDVSKFADYDRRFHDKRRHPVKIDSFRSKYQKIDIIDVLTNQQERVAQHLIEYDPQYLIDNIDLFSPNRVVFMDEVIQSTSLADAGYHETLVHPSLFLVPSSPNQRVAIIGGGEGATLREVLKHKNVQEVVMIDIDPGIILSSRRHLHQWNDCGFLHQGGWKVATGEGGDSYGGNNGNSSSTRTTAATDEMSTSCFDHPKTKLYVEDAIQWFLQRYLHDKDKDGVKPYPKFDVIIMDALDPQEAVDFAGVLYSNNDFLQAISNALHPEGVFVSQVGEALQLVSPDETNSVNRNVVLLEQSLTSVGFQSILGYLGSHVGFDWPWMFYIALKSKASQSDWFSSEARLNYEMQKRSIPTVDGDSPFHYFDSSTMLSFQFPHRGSEVSFCRRHPTPPGCDMGRGFDPEIQNVPLSQLFVANKSDMAGEEDDVGSEHRVITKAVVPRHSYLGLESSVHQVRFESDTLNLIHEQDGHKLLSGNAVADFVQKYGITSNFRGKEVSFASSDVLALVDSDAMGLCNGSSVSASEPDWIRYNVYNPVFHRNTADNYGILISSHHELKEGDEITGSLTRRVGLHGHRTC